ncbi:MAG TPA: hypothetical protein VMZ29_17485 [Candidatus Bathyarchaeia archaeon]|nr:hypothetical protein [Candidatus Bathyarchaeia archaeon]
MSETEEGKLSTKQILAIILILIIILSIIVPIFIDFSSFSIGVIFVILGLGGIFVITYFIIRQYGKKLEKDKIAYFKEYLNENLTEVKISEKSSIKNCQICKLDIKSKHTAVKCPNCKNYFHKEHLIIWFVQNSCCPVCNYDFKYEISQKRKNVPTKSE